MTNTSSSHTQKHHNFLRSVLQWLQVGYPDGVPGPDRVPLMALLQATPLTEEQIKEVVRNITAEEGSPATADHPIDRDEISEFISDMTHYDAGPENIQRVAGRLAAAGWPLAGTSGAGIDPAEPEETSEVVS